jgi:hypothetical protein
MLEFQVHVLTVWWQAAASLRRRLGDSRAQDRGEVTATTAMIVVLVIAAIAAAGVIAARINANAKNVPAP